MKLECEVRHKIASTQKSPFLQSSLGARFSDSLGGRVNGKSMPGDARVSVCACDRECVRDVIGRARNTTSVMSPSCVRISQRLEKTVCLV